MRTLLYCAPVEYASAKQRPQWMAEGLARHYRVLYVDPHRSWPGTRRLRPIERHVTGALHVLTPRATLPLSGYARPLNAAVSRVMAHDIRAALSRLGWSGPAVLVATFPKHVDLLCAFPDARLVYDVMDDYPEFFGARQAAVLARMHEQLLAASHVVTVSSETLRQRCAARAASAPRVIPNAVDDAFAARVDTAIADARCMQHPGPRFGYVGTLAPWIDDDALVALARAVPHGSILLVGPGALAPRGWPPNVHFLGSVPHQEIASILKSFDVGLVPFRKSQLTEAVNPVKVYEYLAAGLPVLATPTVELERFGSAVRLAPAEAWSTAGPALVSERPEPATQRASVARETWSARVDRLVELLDFAS